MFKSSFGKFGQVQFDDEHQYYQLLGYLAKSDGTTCIVWEHNEDQGAWGCERRIKFYVTPPSIFRLSYTRGVGNVLFRVNCNEYMDNIFADHHFRNGVTQNIPAVRSTVPAQYVADFNAGLAL